MSIDPAQSNAISKQLVGARIQAPDAQSGGSVSRPVRPHEHDSGQGMHADKVQLSDATRSTGSAGGSSPSGLSPFRLREVLERLNSGFYDTARVRDHVARQIQKDLDL
jgi:hypothetical protein